MKCIEIDKDIFFFTDESEEKVMKELQKKRKRPCLPKLNFRTCKGTYYNKKDYKTETFELGYFHGWGTDYEELGDGAGHYTAAIVELPDGQIILVPADRIQFLDSLGY